MRKDKKSLSVKRGLRLLKLGWFCHNFMLILPVIVLVYTQKGITVGDFFLIQGLFRIAAVLFEIPSGYMSDVFSRRRILIYAAVVATLGFATVAMAHGFWGIMLGEGLLGVSSALFSGTLEAYTYDLLKRTNSQKDFLREYGSVNTFGDVAAFVGTLLGGMLYAGVGGEMLLWIETSIAAIAIFAYLFVPELTEIKRVVNHKTAVADAIGITWKTIKNPKLRNLIIFPSIFGAFTIMLLWIMQPIMQTAAVPVSLFGFYVGANQLSRAVFSKYAYKICDRFGNMTTSVLSVLSVILSIVAGILAMYVNNMVAVYILCAILAFVPSMQSLVKLQYNTLIHDCVKSQERGTVISTRAMVSM
ncbi:MAG: MFS transporter, partial [Alphaproteobacteria bacterium]|nr:MFS transporter [Alphaproteobacteria bacterium]